MPQGKLSVPASMMHISKETNKESYELSIKRDGSIHAVSLTFITGIIKVNLSFMFSAVQTHH